MVGTSGIGAVLPDPLKIFLDSFRSGRKERRSGIELGISGYHASCQRLVRSLIAKF